jgi:hypothetical protein
MVKDPLITQLKYVLFSNVSGIRMSEFLNGHYNVLWDWALCIHKLTHIFTYVGLQEMYLPPEAFSLWLFKLIPIQRRFGWQPSNLNQKITNLLVLENC